MSILLLFPILIISIPAMIGGIRLMKNGMKAVKEERRQKVGLPRILATQMED